MQPNKKAAQVILLGSFRFSHINIESSSIFNKLCFVYPKEVLEFSIEWISQ